MDTEEEDIARTPKKKKTNEEGQLVQIKDEAKGKNKMEVANPAFEVKEYAFADTPVDSTSQSIRKIEFMERQKETKDINLEETLKLYSKVRNISNQNVSLVSVRDYAHNTLNLVLETHNRVA